MKILHVNTNHRWGGGENQIFHLVSGTQQYGINSFLVAREDGELFQRAQQAGLPVQAFDFTSRHGLFAVARLAYIIRENRPDLLHLHDGDAVSLGSFASKLFPKLPIIIHRRIASPLRDNLLTRWKYSPHRVAGYIAVSVSAQNALLQFGIPREKIQIIPSGIDLTQLHKPSSKAEQLQTLDLPQGLWIGTVTALTAKKDTTTFVHAAAKIAERFPEAKFCVIGDGPQRDSLIQLAGELGLGERLLFTGFLHDVSAYIAAMDLFLFCSHLEGSPGALKEAMALEIPVIAANAPGTNEIVQDGLGILFPPGDVDALTEAALGLLQNPGQMKSLAEQASAFVRAEFSMEIMVERTVEFYRRFVAISLPKR